MASPHSARLCVLGTEQELYRLLCAMLENDCWLDPLDPDSRPKSLQEAAELVAQDTAKDEYGDGFRYSMVHPSPFGSAVPGSCRLRLQPQPGGLWSACFAWQSQDPMQQRDWLHLQQRAGWPLMTALACGENFDEETAAYIFTRDRVHADYDWMDCVWLFLAHSYGEGLPPAEAGAWKRQMDAMLREGELDWTIDEVIRDSEANLHRVMEAAQDPEALARAMDEALQMRDFDALLAARMAIAEAVLWDTEHAQKWLAALRTLANA